jgi:hypothetical protein
MERRLSSPNSMVWNNFQALRRICYRLSEENANDESVRQDAAICVLVAVQCVETFLNIYFRVLVSEDAYAHAKERVLADLQAQSGLDRKIKEWPEIVFGNGLVLGSGAGQRFVALKDLRHKLMHFSSTHETMRFPGFSIEGMADTSAYDAISAQTGIDALEVAEDFICEILVLQGIAVDQLPHALHSWTGRPPAFGQSNGG